MESLGLRKLSLKRKVTITNREVIMTESITDPVAAALAGRLLVRSLEKGIPIEIPSLGITIYPKDRQED